MRRVAFILTAWTAAILAAAAEWSASEPLRNLGLFIIWAVTVLNLCTIYAALFFTDARIARMPVPGRSVIGQAISWTGCAVVVVILASQARFWLAGILVLGVVCSLILRDRIERVMARS